MKTMNVTSNMPQKGKPMKLEKPDGIIVTISKGMYGEKGYRNWLRNFLHAMAQDDMVYWLRLGAVPKHDVLYVYLCIGGKIRFRANYAGADSRGLKTFADGRQMSGNAWLTMAGPVERPPFPILRKGFQGFRYTTKLF